MTKVTTRRAGGGPRGGSDSPKKTGVAPTKPNANPSTKERILTVAEQLFVRYGFKGVSMRLLTRESKVNLSAVHYHFGGMEGVLRAIFERHVVSLNQERHERLDACLVDEQDPLTSVRRLIEAYILPSLRNPPSAKAPKGNFARLQAQLSVDPSPEVRRVIDGGYDEIGTRFAKMLRKIKASGELWGKLVGTIDTKEKFEANRLRLAEHEWARMKANNSLECRNCHGLTYMDTEKQKQRARRQHELAQQDGQTCIDCHKGIAHSKPQGMKEEE